MKKIITGILLVSLSVSVFIFGVSVGRVTAQDNLDAKLDIFLQVLDIVRNDYIDDHLDGSKLVYGAVKGFLAALDDPYTRFMEPKAYKEMKIRMTGSYSGIGIYIGMKDNHLTVISPIRNTPAAKSGLKARDKIMTVDGKDTTDMALEEAVTLIRGPRGTVVRLGILRGENKDLKDYDIVRDNIKIESVETAQINSQIKYIKLNTFENQKAPYQMEKALKEAKQKGVGGVILDLRNNGGGLLTSAIDIGSMFIPAGPIVYTVDRDGNKESLDSNGKVIWDRALVVLVNGASASASEILAGALQDTKTGVLIGDQTFGKALVQNVRVLSDGSAVLVTVAKYLTPNGAYINKKGITPDIVITLTTAEAEALDPLAEKPDPDKDPQLKKAIEILVEEMAKKLVM